MNLINSDNLNHKSLRVRTNIGDKFLNVNLDQTYESLDILSLKIYQKDIYRLFDADYGIIVGRVTGQGVGIPNVKISVFISTEEENIINPTKLEDIKKIEAASVYPFETVYDKDGNGKIYNLLPKYKKNREFNGFPENQYGVGVTPKSPVGTFPEKEEILTNETLAYIYDKYYKYTTTTNQSGDYILIVPSNRTYSVNMSCDITDIGQFSTNAYFLQIENYTSNSFIIDGGGLVINPEIPLEQLQNIDIQNKTVTVKPLWSQNTNNTNVGINRLDFELIKKIEPFTTVFGNQFTHNPSHYWKYNLNCNNGNNPDHICLGTKQKGKLITKIFSIKRSVSESDADKLNSLTSNDNTEQYGYNYDNDIELLKPFIPSNLGTNTIYNYIEIQDGNGNFIYMILCNRNKVITDEEGNLITVDDDNGTGVFTSFRGYFYLENDYKPSIPRVNKIKLKIPQLFDAEYDSNPSNNITRLRTRTSWIWKHYKFDLGNIYSVAQRLEVECPTLPKEEEKEGNQTNILYIVDDKTKFFPPSNDINTQIKRENINQTLDGKYINFYNHLKLSLINRIRGEIIPAFKNQWMNFSIYFENYEYDSSEVSKYISRPQRYRNTNERDIGAKQKNTVFLANGDFINTQFIKIDKSDFINFYEQKYNGITQLGFRIKRDKLNGTYLRIENPTEDVQYFNQDNGNEFYFLIGTNTNNVLQFLIDSKII